jgi:hypothetical protein
MKSKINKKGVKLVRHASGEKLAFGPVQWLKVKPVIANELSKCNSKAELLHATKDILGGIYGRDVAIIKMVDAAVSKLGSSSREAQEA